MLLLPDTSLYGAPDQVAGPDGALTFSYEMSQGLTFSKIHFVHVSYTNLIDMLHGNLS